MFDQLDIVEERYEQLNELLSDPDVVNDSDKLRKYSKEQADLQKTVDVYRNYKAKKEELADIEEMLSETDDKEEVEMLKEESNGIKAELPNLEEELKILLIPKDPNDAPLFDKQHRPSDLRLEDIGFIFQSSHLVP
ncbi:PCRF domain-containing protein, partial [Staphylococcus aureus]|uniref:PCRF domain-containing protein n=1 Tax=Staphylococcus aureus TaxID=1280 RepID=UPI003D08F855